MSLDTLTTTAVLVIVVVVLRYLVGLGRKLGLDERPVKKEHRYQLEPSGKVQPEPVAEPAPAAEEPSGDLGRTLLQHRKDVQQERVRQAVEYPQAESWYADDWRGDVNGQPPF